MEKHRESSRQYLKTPEGKEKNRVRKYRYLKLYRHLDTVLREVINDSDMITLSEIKNRIYEKRKVKFNEDTILNLSKKYELKYGEPLLETIDGDTYKLNLKFYEKLSKRI